MAGPDYKELWVGWTQDAVGQYEPSDDTEDAAEEMADFAMGYADMMLNAFQERDADGDFNANSRPARKRRKKRGEPEED